MRTGLSPPETSSVSKEEGGTPTRDAYRSNCKVCPEVFSTVLSLKAHLTIHKKITLLEVSE